MNTQILQVKVPVQQYEKTQAKVLLLQLYISQSRESLAAKCSEG